MRKYLLLAALAAGLVAPAAIRANGFFQYGQKVPDQYGFKKTHAPRAAPWFVYWPYPAYFTMPAPTGFEGMPPASMSPGGFNQNMYGPGQFMPYPTNGFGQ
jgi:hypothetical protein